MSANLSEGVNESDRTARSVDAVYLCHNHYHLGFGRRYEYDCEMAFLFLKLDLPDDRIQSILQESEFGNRRHCY